MEIISDPKKVEEYMDRMSLVPCRKRLDVFDHPVELVRHLWVSTHRLVPVPELGDDGVVRLGANRASVLSDLYSEIGKRRDDAKSPNGFSERG